MRTTPITASSDVRRAIPAHKGARLDRIDIAIRSLRAELSRLDRLGLAAATARCRQQLRYWEFLKAVFSLDPAALTGRNRAA